MKSSPGMRRVAVVSLVTVVAASVVVWIAKRPSSTWYAQDEDSEKTLKVLFIGNSLTYYHDMPGVVVQMFQHAHPDQKLKVAMVTGPGFKLAQHLQYGDAIEMIESEGPWDWIVLQEYGSLANTDPAQVTQSLNTFTEAARESGAEPIVYLDWHSSAVPGLENPLEKLAVELNLPCVPVAQAWHLSRTEYPEIELQMDDGVHPTEAGAYLIALVFYFYLSHDYSSGLPTGGLSEQDADKLQTIAREVVHGKVPSDETGNAER